MKQLRQRAIRDLVEQRPVRTQQELASALRERGFRTTQATISRDVAELGLIKVGRVGTQAYAIPPRLREAETSGEDRIRTLLRDMPVEIREAGTMLVLKTLPGSAHALAAALDRARWTEVAGSIAGDDTVFVAFPTAARSAAPGGDWRSSPSGLPMHPLGLGPRAAFDETRDRGYHSADLRTSAAPAARPGFFCSNRPSGDAATAGPHLGG